MKPDSPHSATETLDAGWRFDNSYARLHGSLSVRSDPVPVRNPCLAVLNRPLCGDATAVGCPLGHESRAHFDLISE